MKLGVAGDSFMSASVNTDDDGHENVQNNHHTEIIAQRMGYEYITYARVGSSNELIRLQIQELINDKVDVAIIGWSYESRVAISVGNYKPELGIFQANYKQFSNLISVRNNEKFLTTPTELVSLPLGTLLKDNSQIHIKKQHLMYLKSYMNTVYDTEWKLQTDSYIIESGIHALLTAKIPTIMWIDDATWKHVKHNVPSYDDLLSNNFLLINLISKPEIRELLAITGQVQEKNIPYHINNKGQHRVAKHMVNFISKNFKKSG